MHINTLTKHPYFHDNWQHILSVTWTSRHLQKTQRHKYAGMSIRRALHQDANLASKMYVTLTFKQYSSQVSANVATRR